MSECSDDLDEIARQSMEEVDGVSDYRVKHEESTVYFTVSFIQSDHSKIERKVKEFIRSNFEAGVNSTEVGIVSTLGDNPYPDFAVSIGD